MKKSYIEELKSELNKSIRIRLITLYLLFAALVFALIGQILLFFLCVIIVVITIRRQNQW